MKGIILAGGSGTRLHPITKGVSKHLLPVFDKPMIYYSLSVLMLAGIRDILIITTREDQPGFIRLLGDGKDFGVSFSYAVQDNPGGIPQAFIIGEDFIGDESVCLVLGDNIFWGQGFTNILKEAASQNKGATIFAYLVNDPKRFGVVEFDENYQAINIEEKPDNPKSNYAVTGLYFYDNDAIEMAKNLKPSKRGEIEITSLNQKYMERNNLSVKVLGRGYAWLDTGTHESLFEASIFVETIEKRQGFKIACLEEIAFYNSWLSSNEIIKKFGPFPKESYGRYLLNLINDKKK